MEEKRMFGKSIFRLMVYALAGAVALFLGGQLLSSVASVVLAWRLGNIQPLVTVWGGTIIMLIIARKETKEPLSLLLNVVSWACIVYTGVVMLFVVLPYGLIAAFLAMGGTIIGCSRIKEPGSIKCHFSTFLEPVGSLGHSIPILGRASVSHGRSWTSIDKLKMKAIVIPNNMRVTVLDLLRERPLLPVSITRYEECDIMLVRTEGNEKVLKQVEQALAGKGVEGLHVLSLFMTNAILSLPLIEDDIGVTLEEYRVAVEEGTVQKLLEMWPNRITVFPNRNGPRVVVRSDTAPGFDLVQLPHGREAHILLGRDVAQLPMGGVEVARESTA
jgi:hypothetical protein